MLSWSSFNFNKHLTCSCFLSPDHIVVTFPFLKETGGELLIVFFYKILLIVKVVWY